MNLKEMLKDAADNSKATDKLENKNRLVKDCMASPAFGIYAATMTSTLFKVAKEKAYAFRFESPEQSPLTLNRFKRETGYDDGIILEAFKRYYEGQGLKVSFDANGLMISWE